LAFISLNFINFKEYVSKPQFIQALSPAIQTFSNDIPNQLEVTFVACPFPIGNDTELRDRYFLPFCSWLLTSNYSKILILMERNVFDPYQILLPRLEKMFGPRFLFSPEIESDDRHVPYVDDWFLKGLDYSNTPLICWLNADIILPSSWAPKISKIYDYFQEQKTQFCVVSHRCNFDPDLEEIKKLAENSIIPDFDKLPLKNRKHHSLWGIDFFLVNREPMEINFDDIRSYHMGKFFWDPYVTAWFDRNIKTVSLGLDFCSYHVNHHSSGFWFYEPKILENFWLGVVTEHYNDSRPSSAVRYQVKGKYLFHEDEIKSRAELEKEIV